MRPDEKFRQGCIGTSAAAGERKQVPLLLPWGWGVAAGVAASWLFKRMRVGAGPGLWGEWWPGGTHVQKSCPGHCTCWGTSEVAAGLLVFLCLAVCKLSQLQHACSYF